MAQRQKTQIVQSCIVDIQSPLGPKGTIHYSRYEPKLVYARNDAYRFEFWDLSTGALSMVVERRTPRRSRTQTEIILEVRWGIGDVRLPSGLHDVFRADGVYLGTVKLPHDLRQIEIGPDYVLGVARDELGTEHVRMFGLHRGR